MSDKQPRNNYAGNKEIIHYALWGLFNLFYPVNLSLKEGAPIGDFIFNYIPSLTLTAFLGWIIWSISGGKKGKTLMATYFMYAALFFMIFWIGSIFLNP